MWYYGYYVWLLPTMLTCIALVFIVFIVYAMFGVAVSPLFSTMVNAALLLGLLGLAC